MSAETKISALIRLSLQESTSTSQFTFLFLLAFDSSSFSSSFPPKSLALLTYLLVVNKRVLGLFLLTVLGMGKAMRYLLRQGLLLLFSGNSEEFVLGERVAWFKVDALQLQMELFIVSHAAQWLVPVCV